MLLDETYRLLERGWIQFSSAVAADGECVSFADPDAIGFCLLGAFFRAGLNTGAVTDRRSPIFEDTRRLLTNATGKPSLWQFNDAKDTTRNRVLDLVDRVRKTV